MLNSWGDFDGILSMADPRQGMVQIPAGEYRVGSDSFYPEEAPVRSIHVGAFALDIAPVTNAEFARFVADTGYQTVSEKPPDPALYPNLSLIHI